MRIWRHRRKFLAAAVALAVGAPVLGLVWLRTFGPYHIREVTGRTDLGRVSCLHCHRKVTEPPRKPPREGFKMPVGMALTPDGRTLFVACEGSDELLRVDTETAKVVGQLTLAGRPHGVAISPDGERLYVSCRDEDSVVIVEPSSLRRLQTIPVAGEPLGLALDGAGRRLFVALGRENRVAVIDPRNGHIERTLLAGRNPYSAAAGAGIVAVSARLSFVSGRGEAPVSELTLIDAATGRLLDHRRLLSGHLSEGVAVTPDGQAALAGMIRVRNLVPITQVGRGALMTASLVFAETSQGGRTYLLPLDDPARCYADPAGVAVTRDGRMAFVSSGGAATVTSVSLDKVRSLLAENPDPEAIADDLAVSTRYVVARIETRANPKELLLAPRGDLLYVSERLSDSIAVIDTRRLSLVRHIELSEALEETPRHRGEEVFTDASYSFQGQFSCRSCHPDGRADGLSYDFDIDGMGKNILDNRSLRGIKQTAPFKWNGKNPNLFAQCGPRFSLVLTRTDPIPAKDLADLVAFIESVPLPRKREESDEPALARGLALFNRSKTHDGREIPVRKRCPTCHVPPLYTDRLPSDIGSIAKTDTIKAVDTPSLLDVVSSPPYLHDGRARSLEEIWTVYNPKDRHGVTNDMTKAELNDLVAFLRSL